MAKFKKKPEIVEAFQWTGGPDQTEDPEWIVDALEDGRAVIQNTPYGSRLILIGHNKTATVAREGNYIVRDENWHIFPMGKDEFEMTYEPV